jgi:hypothetical protein
VCRLYLDDPDTEYASGLKSGTEKRTRILAQRPDPNYPRKTEQAQPSRWLSPEHPNCTISLRTQFKVAVGREPSWCPHHHNVGFVN